MLRGLSGKTARVFCAEMSTRQKVEPVDPLASFIEFLETEEAENEETSNGYGLIGIIGDICGPLLGTVLMAEGVFDFSTCPARSGAPNFTNDLSRVNKVSVSLGSVQGVFELSDGSPDYTYWVEGNFWRRGTGQRAVKHLHPHARLLFRGLHQDPQAPPADHQSQVQRRRQRHRVAERQLQHHRLPGPGWRVYFHLPVDAVERPYTPCFLYRHHNAGRLLPLGRPGSVRPGNKYCGRADA